MPSLSTAHWRADIRFFAHEVPQHHKNAFHQVSTQQFADAVATLDAQVSHLNNYQIVVGLQRLAAMIGDGHTSVATWNIYRTYLFELFWFDTDLRVVRATTAHKEALGARLVEIGGMSITDVNTRLQQVIPQGENRWYVLQQRAEQIVRAEVLAALGVVPSIEHAAFTFAYLLIAAPVLTPGCTMHGACVLHT